MSPLIAGLQSEQDLQALLLRIGWRPENISQVPLAQILQALQALDDAYTQDLLPLIDQPPTTLSDVPGALQKAGAIVSALAAVSNTLSGIQSAPAGLARTRRGPPGAGRRSIPRPAQPGLDPPLLVAEPDRAAAV